MTPEQLCQKGTESGQQKALFAWAAMAHYKGFVFADDMASYQSEERQPEHVGTYVLAPVAELKWLHAIPNGGNRQKMEAAKLKAEGVRRGVGDVLLPVARHAFHGFYIEMKRLDGGRQSEEQKEFEAFCVEQGYLYRIYTHWRDAADALKAYLDTHRRFRDAPARPVW